MTFITENNIANLYDTLIQFPVFDEFRLPPSSKIDFQVVHDNSICGQYEPPEAGEPHVITISTAKCGHLDTVIKTLCHEIIHMICYLESPKTEKYTSHKGLFSKLQKRVAKMYGFDPKEL